MIIRLAQSPAVNSEGEHTSECSGGGNGLGKLCPPRSANIGAGYIVDDRS